MADALPADHPLRAQVMDLDVLSPAATRFRYPSPTRHLGPPPNAVVLARLLDSADALALAARKHTGR